MVNNEANRDCRFLIRDVWAENLEQEIATIRDVVEKYPYLAMVRPEAMRVISIYPKKGYRISGCGCETYWEFPYLCGLPLPDSTLQRGSSEDHPIGYHVHG